MRNATSQILTAILILSTSGCSHLRPLIFPDDHDNLSGAGSLITYGDSGTQFKTINFNDLLVQHGFAKSDGTNIEIVSTSPPENYKQNRNELQDRLIAASNQRCSLYIRLLTSEKSQNHMFWSGFATLLSGAATVASPTSAVKELAAGATVSNAYDSLYNQTYFQDLTMNVISSGISKRREALLEQITTLQSKPKDAYTVNRAIADALTYHAACNIISGMEVAKDAVQEVDSKKMAPKIKFQ